MKFPNAGKKGLMMFRYSTEAALILLLPLLAGAQRQSPDIAVTPLSTVTARISFDDSSIPTTPVRVKLLSRLSIPLSSSVTRDDGKAEFNNLQPGDYQLQVAGTEIEETTVSFTIYPRQLVVPVPVSVRRKATAADKSSRDGAVSTATLNIPEKARQEFEKGMHAMNETKWDDADKHFSKAIDQYPNYAAAWNARGVVLMRSQKAPDAHSAFEKAIAADGQFSSAYVNLAKLLILEKKNAEAETLLGKAISLNPRDPNALAVLANLDLTTGRLDEAIQECQTLKQSPQSRVQGAILYARILIRRNFSQPSSKNDWAEVADDLKAIQKTDPKALGIDILLADVQIVQQDYEHARKTLDVAIQNTSSDAAPSIGYRRASMSIVRFRCLRAYSGSSPQETTRSG